jgi:hypothetical protein
MPRREVYQCKKDKALPDCFEAKRIEIRGGSAKNAGKPNRRGCAQGCAFSGDSAQKFLWNARWKIR